MALQIIGAGLGRTGTTSLMVALEQLLGQPCYHMAKLSQHPEHVAEFHRAAQGFDVDWQVLFHTYQAMTDWPAAAFYLQLMQVYPEAKVLLSYREAESWYASCEATIFPAIKRAEGEWGEMIRAVVYNTFCANLDDKADCLAAFEQHREAVRAAVPSNRLIEWQPGDGWQPLCAGLGLPIPDQPYPHVNTTEDFLSRQR